MLAPPPGRTSRLCRWRSVFFWLLGVVFSLVTVFILWSDTFLDSADVESCFRTELDCNETKDAVRLTFRGDRETDPPEAEEEHDEAAGSHGDSDPQSTTERLESENLQMQVRLDALQIELAAEHAQASELRRRLHIANREARVVKGVLKAKEDMQAKAEDEKAKIRELNSRLQSTSAEARVLQEKLARAKAEVELQSRLIQRARTQDTDKTANSAEVLTDHDPLEEHLAFRRAKEEEIDSTETMLAAHRGALDDAIQNRIESETMERGTHDVELKTLTTKIEAGERHLRKLKDELKEREDKLQAQLRAHDAAATFPNQSSTSNSLLPKARINCDEIQRAVDDEVKLMRTIVAVLESSPRNQTRPTWQVKSLLDHLRTVLHNSSHTNSIEWIMSTDKNHTKTISTVLFRIIESRNNIVRQCKVKSDNAMWLEEYLVVRRTKEEALLDKIDHAETKLAGLRGALDDAKQQLDDNAVRELYTTAQFEAEKTHVSLMTAKIEAGESNLSKLRDKFVRQKEMTSEVRKLLLDQIADAHHDTDATFPDRSDEYWNPVLDTSALRRIHATAEEDHVFDQANFSIQFGEYYNNELYRQFGEIRARRKVEGKVFSAVRWNLRKYFGKFKCNVSFPDEVPPLKPLPPSVAVQSNLRDVDTLPQLAFSPLCEVPTQSHVSWLPNSPKPLGRTGAVVMLMLEWSPNYTQPLTILLNVLETVPCDWKLQIFVTEAATIGLNATVLQTPLGKILVQHGRLHVHLLPESVFLKEFPRFRDASNETVFRRSGKAGSFHQRLRWLSLSPLMTSAWFWKATLPVDFVLLVQPDVALCAKNAHKFSNFLHENVTYIGAPWNQGSSSAWFLRGYQVGNGGLSLRRRDAMLHVATRVQYLMQQVQEDVWWGRQLCEAGMPPEPVKIAREFASENIFNPNAFGFHKIKLNLDQAGRAFAQCPELHRLIDDDKWRAQIVLGERPPWAVAPVPLLKEAPQSVIDAWNLHVAPPKHGKGYKLPQYPVQQQPGRTRWRGFKKTANVTWRVRSRERKQS